MIPKARDVKAFKPFRRTKSVDYGHAQRYFAHHIKAKHDHSLVHRSDFATEPVVGRIAHLQQARRDHLVLAYKLSKCSRIGIWVIYEFK